ncbi:MAG: WYL domain-containing protein [Oscillospiraceae bacterium]|nr:WYL domain-containing protein [Oscillospiraceae bacterium]
MKKRKYLDFKNYENGNIVCFAKDRTDKLQLRLSYFAWSVILNDMRTYGLKRNGILNLIFYNMCADYSESYDVFAYAALGRKNEALKVYIKEDSPKFNKELQDYLSDINDRINDLMSADSYRVNIVLSKDNCRYLAQECFEATVYGEYRLNIFFRAVIERYASLAHFEREKIINAEKVNLIRTAINENNILEITTGKETRSKEETFYAKPYKIMADPLTTFSYLVGLGCKVNDPNRNWKVASFRIARTGEIRKTSKDGSLTQIEINEIEDKVKERSIQYLLADVVEIKVLLTVHGMNTYNTVLQSRPVLSEMPEKLDDGRYLLKFLCSTKQAYDYFFGFGTRAEIIAPEELRNQFANEYQSAANLYPENMGVTPKI